MYKISVIVPVFNVEDTLQNAFDSILNQSIGFENLEVIFVDDKSTDKSADIIKGYSKKYNNVKSFILDENSGFAGKPRNIGIENATAPYLMFLDPDDIFLEDACEILYDNISKNNLELVSGNYNINRDNEIVRNNWNILKLKDTESSQVKNVDENFNMLLATPSVWSKIFKKDFILKENIQFLEGVPAQDLVFVSEALLKSDGIKFINTPVVEYIPRQSGESVTSKKSKSVLAGFIKSYTAVLNIAKEHDENYAWLGPRNLFFWIKQFCLSDLPIKDKIDLLYMANPLFEEFIQSPKINPPQYLKEFLELIAKKDFLNASKISEKLDIFYDEHIVERNIKDKDIFLLFYGLDIEIGGLAKATFNRANILKQHGYKVTLLNVNESKNFKYITQYFHENGYLDKNIEIINLVEYYATKNDLNNKIPERKEPNGYTLETIEKNDKTKITNYYVLNDKLVKSRHEFDNYTCVKIFNHKGQVKLEKYYTKDNFNYLTKKYGVYTLNDRFTNLKIKFKDMFELHNYFITEMLFNCNEKAFLINENSGAIPNFNNINSELAYKIASIHTNPYSENHHYGSPLRDDFTILNDVKSLDYIVVLTEKLKDDLVKEFNIENIKAIPNILNMSEYEGDNKYPKDNTKISIFARLSYEKNIEDAIKAFNIVCQKRKDVRLEIFGRAVAPNELIEEKRLRELVKELNLEDKVIFKGHVDNVNEEMSKSLATLFVSNFEGLGLVVLESMINKTPVISYDINYGPSDFIKDDVNGYLVEQHDTDTLAQKILHLLENPDKAIEMGKIAKRDVLKQIDNETLFLKWENVLKEVYIASRKDELKFNEIDPDIMNELKTLQRDKMRLYRSKEKLHKQNRILKSQINESNVKKIFKKIKRGN